MGIAITKYDHESPKLWPLLGPLVTSRDVQKELGGPVFSSPNTTWFIAVDGKQVVGFSSLRVSPQGYWFDYTYVVPDRRKKGIHKRLAKEQDTYLATLPPQSLLVCTPKRRWPHYEKQGFTIQRERGSWVYGIKS